LLALIFTCEGISTTNGGFDEGFTFWGFGDFWHFGDFWSLGDDDLLWVGVFEVRLVVFGSFLWVNGGLGMLSSC
jgi:hypothetical protein